MLRRTKGKNPFLGAALLFVAPCSAEGGIETILVQRLLEGLGFHDIGVDTRAMSYRADSLTESFLVGVDDEIHTKRFHHQVSKFVHRTKLPSRVDV